MYLKSILRFVVCFAISVFFSCKKQIDTPIYSDKLIIGTEEKVNKTSCNVQLTSLYDIDVNEDKTNDFRIAFSSTKGPAGASSPSLRIECLNEESMILSLSIKDTTFLQKRIFQLINGSKVNIINTFTNSCWRQDASDSIIKITDGLIKINPKKEEDILNSSDEFHSKTIILYTTSLLTKIGTTQTINDTIISNHYYIDDACHMLPKQEISYIGFKFKDSGSERMGWIKLDIGEFYTTKISEFAIQK